MENAEYIELLEANVSILTSHGTYWISRVESNLILLEKHFSAEIHLPESQLKEVLHSAIDAAIKHRNMLKLSIEERKHYISPDSPNK
jgi:hypothetical protein